MNKKLLVFCMVLLVGNITTLSAETGGFTGPGLQVTTVKQAKTFRDDTPVVLQGRILRSLGNEKYMFSDNTGTIVVEIDDDLWRGISVSENDLVEIHGEVDKNFRTVEIDADSIRKIVKK